MAGERYLTRDHERIREWAEERGGKPSAVRDTGGGDDPGIIRIDFPGYSGEGSLEEIPWEEWFEKFDESDLVLLHQETTADGEKSNFNKLIKASTARDAEDNAEWIGEESTSGAGDRSSGSRPGSAPRRSSRTSKSKSRT
jgi:hypothetical protein